MKAAATAGYIAVCELHYATVVQCVSQSLFPTQEEMETTKIVSKDTRIGLSKRINIRYNSKNVEGYTLTVYPVHPLTVTRVITTAPRKILGAAMDGHFCHFSLAGFQNKLDREGVIR